MSQSETERAGVARFDDLAERITAEHRAVERAALTALEHALAAGDLLVRAKDGIPHGSWRAWVEGGCGFSLRTAQVYMHLARRRNEVEEAKAQSPALLSIDGAMRALAAPALPPPWAVGPEPDLTPPEGARIDPDVERGMEEEREFWAAWERPQKEALAGMHAAERVQEAGAKLIPVASGLHALAHPREGFQPEEAGEALVLMGVDTRQVAALRDCAAWLLRVAEEAERRLGDRP